MATAAKFRRIPDSFCGSLENGLCPTDTIIGMEQTSVGGRISIKPRSRRLSLFNLSLLSLVVLSPLKLKKKQIPH